MTEEISKKLEELEETINYTRIEGWQNRDKIKDMQDLSIRACNENDVKYCIKTVEDKTRQEEFKVLLQELREFKNTFHATEFGLECIKKAVYSTCTGNCERMKKDIEEFKYDLAKKFTLLQGQFDTLLDSFKGSGLLKKFDDYLAKM